MTDEELTRRGNEISDRTRPLDGHLHQIGDEIPITSGRIVTLSIDSYSLSCQGAEALIEINLYEERKLLKSRLFRLDFLVDLAKNKAAKYTRGGVDYSGSVRGNLAVICWNRSDPLEKFDQPETLSLIRDELATIADTLSPYRDWPLIRKL